MQKPTLYVFNRRGPLVHHLRSDVLRPPSVNGPWTSKKSCRFVTSEIGTVRNEDGASAVMASGRTGCGIRDANMRSTSRETVWVFARTVDKLRSAYRHCNDDRAVHTLEQTVYSVWLCFVALGNTSSAFWRRARPAFLIKINVDRTSVNCVRSSEWRL